MRIYNLTQHKLTLEQEMAGAYTDHNHNLVKQALTFTEMPNQEMIREKVIALLDCVHMALLDYTQMHYEHTFDDMKDASASDEEAEAAGMKAIAKAESEFAIMLGGAPYLMAPLEGALKECGFRVVYAYSERVGEEHTKPDGSVLKSFTFKHLGFYEA